ncbi:Uncharacterized protein OBRU01_24633 [Operophtera brumata]|uniref:Uncharacterized protein n=1 Tax=Operophtera brumata TaxID=104452 RepID=A0A0L7KIU7_OPEBR|nr:Uncharacterized protein OBRU01_24633 [Operophtera brumata]
MEDINSIKITMAQMMENFTKDMAHFQGELNKQAVVETSPPTISSLASQFHAFKTFTVQALQVLQCQVETIGKVADQIEMDSRRNILLLHGLPEENTEDTAAVITKAIVEKLKLSEFTSSDISRCHRMGRLSAPDRPRPILFKLHSAQVRSKIWSSKSSLKSTGVTLSEFLTKARHEAFMAAREKFGVAKCWTWEGSVYVLGHDGKRHRVVSCKEVHGIALARCTVSPGQATAPKAAVAPQLRPKSSRRIAAAGAAVAKK